jgi:hypothetical protein
MQIEFLLKLNPLDFSPSSRFLCQRYFEDSNIPNLFLVESIRGLGASVSFQNTRITKDWLSALYLLNRDAATDFTRFVLSPSTWAEETKKAIPADVIPAKENGGLYEQILNNAFHLAVETRNIEALNLFLELVPEQEPSHPQLMSYCQTILSRQFKPSNLLGALLLKRSHYNPHLKDRPAHTEYTLIDAWHKPLSKPLSTKAAPPIELLSFLNQLMLKMNSTTPSWGQAEAQVQAIVTCCLGSLNDKRLPSLLRECLGNQPELQTPNACRQIWPYVFGNKLFQQIYSEPRKKPGETTQQFKKLLETFECFEPSALQAIQSMGFSTIERHLNNAPSYHMEDLTLKTDLEHYIQQIDGLTQLKNTENISLDPFLARVSKGFKSLRPFSSSSFGAYKIADLTKTQQKIADHLYKLTTHVRAIHPINTFLEDCVSRYEHHSLQKQADITPAPQNQRRVL